MSMSTVYSIRPQKSSKKICLSGNAQIHRIHLAEAGGGPPADALRAGEEAPEYADGPDPAVTLVGGEQVNQRTSDQNDNTS